ncbi:hypothetical protein PSSM4_070.3 [Prochlorococcus phage P-SSM4]|uniref:Uncharacterized protein n=1 Tax=Prochlorococcus phage P-SSM4 TaxID=268747 RepID=E2PTZ4_BPPRS|nr:hypothetical protein PSSM4_070.3 [Prochlorococcus phage P-SSM4]ADK66290.1 hypothetical protein PSSM4_070.3 [Prochlorococcus phage P-SSM4]
MIYNKPCKRFKGKLCFSCLISIESYGIISQYFQTC